MSDWLAGIVVVGGIMLCCLLVGVAVNRLDDRFEAIAAQAAVEQLRADAIKINATSNEDVMGQITQWNQAIRGKHRLIQTKLGWIVTSTKWRDVQVIQIPRT